MVIIPNTLQPKGFQKSTFLYRKHIDPIFHGDNKTRSCPAPLRSLRLPSFNFSRVQEMKEIMMCEGQWSRHLTLSCAKRQKCNL
ncbi:unnamed protein product [Cuscuta campestris]|uniref:Uncharacterized protein n=1 Tax=Cuscuta campestris TaxID=132261 RepID=A0A484LCQ9_9ASTE|nr:unnamed protein product [Cuscuta campestris]